KDLDTPKAVRIFLYPDQRRGHSEMGSRDHGMVEFGVQIPMAPMSGTSFSSRSKSKGFLRENSRFPQFKRTVSSTMLRIVRFALVVRRKPPLLQGLREFKR